MNIHQLIKKSILLTLIGFLTTQAYATPTKSTKPTKPKAPKTVLEQQLAKYISCPDALSSTRKAGVVVVQFRVNAKNEVCSVEVFSHNKQINNSLTSQLVGKRVVGYGSDTTQRHTVRLRFQPE